MTLTDWAARWRLPLEAFQELCALSMPDTKGSADASESAIQSRFRLAGAHRGELWWRNNRGAGKTAAGTWIRYGLANDSQKLGDRVKSADLIGIIPRLITAEMVGSIVGQFASAEIKRSGWKFSGSKEEIAQLAWATIVKSKGGYSVITSRETL